MPGRLSDVASVEGVRAAVLRHPHVSAVTLVGSRARGDATEFSDWDFKVLTDDFPQVAGELAGWVARLDPLGCLWDPLSDEACFMVIVDGPTKLDFIFDEPGQHAPPWRVSGETLAEIDMHFWDWTLWLCAKQHAGKHALVATQLGHMFNYLLRPMGMARSPATLKDAAAAYESLRASREQESGTAVARRLGHQVARVVSSLP
jgi:hypothetical protein